MSDKNAENPCFIEVKRVVSEKKLNVGTNLECYPVSAIHTFRRWHKGENDVKIEGDMLLLCLYPTKQEPKKTGVVENGTAREVTIDPNMKMKTILIQESYESFLYRFNEKVPVKRAPEDEF